MSSYCRLKRALLIALLCASGGPYVHAADKTWVVGVEDTRYYPHYDSVGGRWQGFGARILEMFGEAAGYRLEFRPMPVERLFRSFLLGEVDFKYPSAPAWKTDQKTGLAIVYSDPVVSYTDGTSVLPERAGRRISDIKKLGIIRGFTPISWADLISSGNVELVPTDSFPSLILQVLRGRVDAIYANTAVVEYQVSHLESRSGKPDQLVFDTGLPYDQGFYRLATLEHSKVVEQFNLWMSQNASLIDALKIEYFRSPQP